MNIGLIRGVGKKIVRKYRNNKNTELPITEIHKYKIKKYRNRNERMRNTNHRITDIQDKQKFTYESQVTHKSKVTHNSFISNELWVNLKSYPHLADTGFSTNTFVID